MSSDSRDATGTAPNLLPFPTIAERFWSGDVTLDELRELLRLILAWRAGTVQSLKRDRDLLGLSEAMTDLLLWTLGERPVPAVDLSAYQVQPFPLHTAGAPDPVTAYSAIRQEVVSILVWRASIIDFLADVWDVVGPPLFDMDETRRAEALFRPAQPVGVETCPFCFQSLDGTAPDKIPRTHFERCPVQGHLSAKQF